jgi:hypothetical protein
MCAHQKVLHTGKSAQTPGVNLRQRRRCGDLLCPGAGMEFGSGVCVDPEGEFMITDSDVVAVVEGGGRADALVLYMHAVR